MIPGEDSFIPFRLISECIKNRKYEVWKKKKLIFFLLACLLTQWVMLVDYRRKPGRETLLQMLGCSLSGL